MSFLGSLVGGVIGAELDHLVAGYIQQHGGLSALVQKFESQGMGPSCNPGSATVPISPLQLISYIGCWVRMQ